MKVYQICEFLQTDDVYIVNKEGHVLLHAEGRDAVQAVALVFEHSDVVRLVPTKNAIEIVIEGA